MFAFILGLICTLLALAAWILLRTYWRVPLREMRRAASREDKRMQVVIEASAYGTSLRGVLWVLLVLFVALALLFFSAALGLFGAIVMVVVLLGILGFVFVPSGELNHSSVWLAKRAAPLLVRLMGAVQPRTRKVERFITKHHPASTHTGLYEKADITDLLTRQKQQRDSRVTEREIAVLQRALTLSDKKVSDIMTRAGGRDVHEVAHKPIYVHADFTLEQAAAAFLKTKQHEAFVIDTSETMVGVVTMDQVLAELLGKTVMEEFENYDDIKAIVTHDLPSTPEPPEVVQYPEHENTRKPNDKRGR